MLTILTDEFYVRDVSGNEMVIYNGTNLEHWNLWGLDNFGKIDANNQKSFYLKDPIVQKYSNDLLGYGDNRKVPTKEHVTWFLNRINLSKNEQVVKGVHNEK